MIAIKYIDANPSVHDDDTDHGPLPSSMFTSMFVDHGIDAALGPLHAFD